MPNKSLSREFQIAQLALKHARDAKETLDKNAWNSYVSLVKGFGSKVANSGLLGAMSFLLAKSKKATEHRKLFDQIVELLREVDGVKFPEGVMGVIDKLIAPDSVTDYMRWQLVTLEYLSYLRRYASAISD